MDHNKLWKILKEVEIPDPFTCLLRNLYTGQEEIVRTIHGTTHWFHIGKGVCQGCMEKVMAPHSSILAWKIPWMEEPSRLQSMGLQKVDTTERLHFYFSLSCIGEGTGNPLQYSCLEDPRNGGAWWAAVYGVAQSRTRLKRLSSSSSSSNRLFLLPKKLNLRKRPCF